MNARDEEQVGDVDALGNSAFPDAFAEDASAEIPSDNETELYISQVGELLGVSSAMIRRWEATGLVEPHRNPAGFRLYRMHDVERLRRVRDLAQSGLNPEGIRRELAHEAGEPLPVVAATVDQTTVGSRLARLRKSSGYSLRALAEKAELSASHLSSIERSLSHPSVALLQKVAAALDTNMINILGGDFKEDHLIVKPNERRPLDGVMNGVEIQQLYQVETVLESLLFVVQPGASSGETYRHQGEEFLFGLEGSLEIILDGTQLYTINAGDSMTFGSHRPHIFRNSGSTVAQVLWINTPPTF